ncbi:MAG: energy transducer TonB [Nitrospirae bacterium]|nr:energy transducer TonB [Nitrospirota bacterium]
MKLNPYIITSLIGHLLILGILAVFYPKEEAAFPFFDVDIVDELQVIPRALPKPLPKTEVPHPEKKRLPKIKSITPPDKTLSPTDIYGEGTKKEGGGDAKKSEEAGRPEGLTNSDSLSPEASLDKKGTTAPPLTKKETPKPKGFLFDKETIEKFAKKTPSSEKEKGLTFDEAEFKHRGYLRMLKEKIESIWKYPPEAARRGITGDLYIRFSIKKDGGIADVELIRTSGHKDLDEAAIKALKNGAPYWPLPDDWDKDEFTITGHFIYLPGSYYVM